MDPLLVNAAGLLRLPVRRRIYDYVRAVPGVHLRLLQRTLGMPLGTLDYHLYQMERGELLITRDLDRFKAYFARYGLDRRDCDHLYYLRQPKPRRLMREMWHEPGVAFKSLRQRVPISSGTLSYHLAKLVNASLINVETRGRHKAYSLSEPDRYGRLSQMYKESFSEDGMHRILQRIDEAHEQLPDNERALTIMDLREAVLNPPPGLAGLNG